MMGMMGREQRDNAADVATRPSAETGTVQTSGKGGAACH
jgi:hypothetical protein